MYRTHVKQSWLSNAATNTIQMGQAGVGATPAGGIALLSMVHTEYGAYRNSNSPGTLLLGTWFRCLQRYRSCAGRVSSTTCVARHRPFGLWLLLAQKHFYCKSFKFWLAFKRLLASGSELAHLSESTITNCGKGKERARGRQLISAQRHCVNKRQ